ncbi:phosphoribosyltransferase family protein [Rhizobium leguminosarum]|uniref:phosphoribosyltransferase family protein n=1 Tax=Rhizobium johnstonii TaxID=3019933 RepID=UPI0013EF3406
MWNMRLSRGRSDYGLLSVEDRKLLIACDRFYFNSQHFERRCLLFVDDVKITSTHQNKLIDLINEQHELRACMALRGVGLDQISELLARCTPLIIPIPIMLIITGPSCSLRLFSTRGAWRHRRRWNLRPGSRFPRDLRQSQNARGVAARRYKHFL